MFFPKYKEAIVTNPTIIEAPFRITLQSDYGDISHICYYAEDDEVVKNYMGYIGNNGTPEGREAIRQDMGYILAVQATQETDKDGNKSGSAEESVWMQDTYCDE